MNLLLRPWRHYADFRGRARRLEYLLFVLTFYGGLIGIALLGWFLNLNFGSLAGKATFSLFVSAPILLFILASVVPGLAVTVRRMHDLGLPGAWLAIVFVPFIGQVLGWLLTFIIIFIPAPRGENRYGFDPRDPEDADDTAALGEVFS
ncbi:DUF805 domain-containing protein [Sphingomonas sp. RT2P30]|uniref:DUF805 domain-containing protein n=1 Tax=Parasphingomonas halimpatiens TaxID=3096162 RepID=UPI002FC8CE68